MALFLSLTNGASVRFCGSLVKSLGRGQAYELQVEAVDVLGECEPEVRTRIIDGLRISN
jgi:hypothetical protein